MLHRRPTAGLTLIELLIVVAVMGILAGLVLPSSNPSLHDQLRSAAQILAGDLAYGRSLAVTHNSRYQFTFDLTGAKTARLSGYMDSVSPAPGDGGNFRVSASRDGETWDTLLDGRGPFAWREVNLTPYAGNEVFVKFENPTDKGQCRVKQWLLKTTPARRTSK